MPTALLQLELLLSEGTVDLAGLASTIRNDVGLSVELLRMAATGIDGCSHQVLAVSDLIVLAGLDRIRAMAERCVALSHNPKDNARFAGCQRFWMHSQLTAHVAEELANQFADITKQEAFFAGLFYQLSAIPIHLGWDFAASPTRELGEFVYELATQWHLPPVLADVIRGHRELCRSPKSRALLDLAGVASTWAYRLEFLAARESETIRAANPPYIYRFPLERRSLP